jgi:hypothetical protein
MPTRPVPPPAEFVGLTHRPSTSWLEIHADVCCYVCGELCGVASCRQQDVAARVVTFRPCRSTRVVRLPIAQLRCSRCRGQVYFDEPRTVRAWDDDVNWALDQPRRGRPPKWLLSLRGDAA